jgi:hypothetical protein
MKITLTHDDVLTAVRENLIRQGFSVPESGTDSFGVFWNGELAQVTVEVDDISIAIPAPAHSVAADALPRRPPARAPAGRFDPAPSPPREKLDTPDRTLGDEEEPLPERVNNERSIKGMIAQSQDFVRRIPDPAKVAHATAREKFPRVQVAQSIEDFGKDPTDFGDEV